MVGSAVVLQLIALFFCCVSGAFLQYGSTRLSNPHPNVTLTVGASNQRVLCGQNTGPVPTSIKWYNPEGQLVSSNNRDEVNQVAGTGGGRVSALTFQSYQQSQGGKYECRVAGPGNNMERLAVCISPTSRFCVWPSVQGTSPTLIVVWELFASGAVTYTVKYSTQPGEVNTAPEGALEVTGISGTSTILTALERGTTYYIWVVGVSEGGEEQHSNRTSGVTYDNVPHPTNGSVSVVALNEEGKVGVTWSRPTLGPGQVITGYSVQYRRRGTTSYTTHSESVSSITSCTITKLNLGVVYEVRIASVGPLGLSGYCCGNGKQVTTYNYTPPPTDGSVLVVALDEAGKVRVTWSTPTLGPGQMITGYSVEYRRSGATPYITRSVSGSSTDNITNLTLGAVYEVRVASEGPLGLSGYCCGSGKQVTTYDNVPRPTAASVSVEALNETGNVRVTWSRPTLGPGQVITGYSVQYRRKGTTPYTTRSVCSNTTSYTITNLNLGTVYQVRVASVGPLGQSGYCCGRGRKVTTYSMNATLKAVLPTTLSTGMPTAMSTAQSIVMSTALPAALSTVTSTTLSTVMSTALPTALSTGLPTTLFTVTSTAQPTMISTAQPTAQSTVMPVENPSTGAVVVAVVAAVGLLLLIITALVVVIAIVVRLKTKTMYFKPDGTRDKKDRQKASPHTPHMQHGQADWKVADNEFTEMTAVQASIDSQEAPSQQSRPVPKSDFSELVKAMHKERDSGFEKEYMIMTTVPDGVRDIAIANSSKNRYQNIHTYDASRVVLSVPDAVGSDYINASFINGYKQRSAYIASQGPNPETISDFIQMIWDQKPPVVVMLTRLFEKGKPKCERYWLEELNKPLEMPDRGFTVTVTGKKDYADYEIRDMAIRYDDDPSAKPLKVKHFFFTAWPDHGVPQHPYSLVKFIQHVRKMVLNSTAPLVVHCSAGVGRTGTFIAVDAMMQRLKEKDDLDIYNFVTQMRTKRTFMVQNVDQYAFIHDALNDYLRCGNTAVAAHNLHVVMTNLRKEDQQTNCSGFEEQFTLLQELSQVPCTTDVNFANKASIMKRNRYKDRFPYSTGYLHLPGKAAQEASKTAVDYYNANYVDGYSVPRAFIAAQSPMSHTKGDFWELVWQFRTPTIVLLTNFMDGSQEACANLWPVTEYEASEHYEVTCNGFQPYEGYDVIKLEVVNRTRHDSTPLEVTAFHFKKWPRDGNPETLPLLEMMGKVERACQKKDKAALVMCDDGMSRTGVFIAAMCEVERVKVEGEVDFFQTIKAMRKQRPHMVYNKEQYTLCFELLQAYLDSFDTYANFKAL